MTEVTLFPPEKNAAKLALEKFDYGDIISREWLLEHFDMEEPNTVKEYRTFMFKFLSAFDTFRTQLLVEGKKMLVNVRGVGYQIIKPNDQTDHAMTEFTKQVNKACNNAAMNLAHVNTAMLSCEELRKNADAQARVGHFKAMNRKKKLEYATGGTHKQLN